MKIIAEALSKNRVAYFANLTNTQTQPGQKKSTIREALRDRVEAEG